MSWEEKKEETQKRLGGWIKAKKMMRIQTKPYPVGNNHLLCNKPESTFGMLRNIAELTMAGENIEVTSKYEARAPSKKWKHWIWDCFMSHLDKYARRFRPMEFKSYEMKVRLNDIEAKMLIDDLIVHCEGRKDKSQ